MRFVHGGQTQHGCSDWTITGIDYLIRRVPDDAHLQRDSKFVRLATVYRIVMLRSGGALGARLVHRLVNESVVNDFPTKSDSESFSHRSAVVPQPSPLGICFCHNKPAPVEPVLLAHGNTDRSNDRREMPCRAKPNRGV